MIHIEQVIDKELKRIRSYMERHFRYQDMMGVRFLGHRKFVRFSVN